MLRAKTGAILGPFWTSSGLSILSFVFYLIFSVRYFLYGSDF